MKKLSCIAIFAAFAMSCGAATTYYVATNGVDTGANDGLSWAQPFKTINKAVAQTDSVLVLVSNGVYSLGATIQIANAITVRSLNGAAATVIDGSNTVRCLMTSNANAVVDGFTITRGRTASPNTQGAGVLCYAGLVANCVITSNTISVGAGNGVTEGGAGVFLVSGTVSNCLIGYNTANGNPPGGGIRLGGASALVTHCRITGNYAGAVGSGAHAAAGGTFRNCLIFRNLSDVTTCGAVYLSGGAVMQNCTVTANTSLKTSAVNVGSAVIANSIIRDNIYLLSAPTNFVASPAITYSCLEFPYTGTGNVCTNPIFWDPAATNYSLSPGSPCLDAGTNGSWTTGTTDLAGNPRVGNSQCDMGAYEYTLGALTCSVAASPERGLAPLNVTLTAKTYGSNTNGLYYRWSYTNNAVIDQEGLGAQTVSRIYPAGGLFTVTLVVSNQAGEVAQDSQLLKISAPTCYVSRAGTQIYPYADWATAATNVQAAVDAAVAGATVLLTNGNYTNTMKDLTISDAITLTSVNGMASTFIVGGGYRCLFLDNPSAVVERVTLKNPVGRNGSGGCVYIRTGTLREARTTAGQLNGGGSTGGGAGAYVIDGTLSNCLVDANGNNNTSAGTGVRLAGNGLVTHCTIKDNYCTSATAGQGVGISVDTGGTVRNSLIYSNYCSATVAGANLAIGARMENCTVAGNYGPGGPSNGAVAVANGSIIVNSIIRDNIYTVMAPTGFSAATPVITYCDTEFPWPGESNLCTNALFMDPAAFNFNLAGSSPCIDAGSNLSWTVAGEKDLAGNPRVSNGRVDLGAYELTLGALTCSIMASPTRGLSPLPVALEASVVGANTSGLYYRWSFTNGAVIDLEGNDKQAVTNNYGPGTPTVTLLVSNAVGEVAQNTQNLKISAPTCYVARAGFNTSTFPYTNWATAASNILDAVNEAVAGTVVLVSNGFYSLTQQVTLAEAITVRSVNGSLGTTVDGGGAVRCFYLQDPGAMVQGLTLSRGYNAEQGGCVYLSYGTVADCVITNGNVPGGGSTGGGGGAYMINGLVSNCMIYGSSVAEHGGGVYVTGAGLVTHCLIQSNRANGTAAQASAGGGAFLSGGTLRNCLVAQNQATNGGGVSLNAAIMENCTVISNTSAGTSGGAVQALLSSSVIVNSIVRDNIYQDGIPVSFGGTPSVSYSCLEFAMAGVSNIAVVAQFKNPAARDYSLASGSPCINAGTNLAWMTANAVDLAGKKRVEMRIVDMGAYEYPTSPGTVYSLR